MTETVPIPRYYLYGALEGDDGAEVELDFLHIEPIHKRSGAYDWRIQPHSHPHHFQVLYVATGGGTLDIEDRQVAIATPCLMSLPSGAIHRIQFFPDTDGAVITAALPFVAQSSLGDAGLLETTRVGGVFPLGGTGLDPAQVEGCFAELSREFVYSAPGRRPAIMAHFITVLVALMRAQRHAAHAGLPTDDRSYGLALRYRDLVEQHFRKERRIEFYAGALGVTPARLNAACKARLGTTASGLLHDRVITEAKRWLIYTGMSVAEIGYALGFEDPAYFSRFFSKRTGIAPGRLRDELGAGPPVLPTDAAAPAAAP